MVFPKHYHHIVARERDIEYTVTRTPFIVLYKAKPIYPTRYNKTLLYIELGLFIEFPYVIIPREESNENIKIPL